MAVVAPGTVASIPSAMAGSPKRHISTRSCHNLTICGRESFHINNNFMREFVQELSSRTISRGRSSCFVSEAYLIRVKLKILNVKTYATF